MITVHCTNCNKPLLEENISYSNLYDKEDNKHGHIQGDCICGHSMYAWYKGHKENREEAKEYLINFNK